MLRAEEVGKHSALREGKPEGGAGGRSVRRRSRGFLCLGAYTSEDLRLYACGFGRRARGEHRLQTPQNLAPSSHADRDWDCRIDMQPSVRACAVGSCGQQGGPCTRGARRSTPCLWRTAAVSKRCGWREGSHVQQQGSVHLRRRPPQPPLPRRGRRRGRR